MSILLVRNNQNFKASEICAVALYALAYENEFTDNFLFSKEFQPDHPHASIGYGWPDDPEPEHSEQERFGGGAPATSVWTALHKLIIQNVCSCEDISYFVLHKVDADVYDKIIADIDTKPHHIYPTFGQLIQYMNHTPGGFHSAVMVMDQIIRPVILNSFRRWSTYEKELEVMKRGFETSIANNLEVILLQHKCKSINTFLRLNDHLQRIKFILFYNDDDSLTIWTVDYNHMDSVPYVRIKAPRYVNLRVKKSSGKMAVAEDLEDAVATVKNSLANYYALINIPSRFLRWMR